MTELDSPVPLAVPSASGVWMQCDTWSHVLVAITCLDSTLSGTVNPSNLFLPEFALSAYFITATKTKLI